MYSLYTISEEYYLIKLFSFGLKYIKSFSFVRASTLISL